MLMFMTMRKLKRTAMNAITSVDLYEYARSDRIMFRMTKNVSKRREDKIRRILWD
ncbi:hypothetical protein JPSP30_06540 [Staphylococcus pseudintermedius]